MKFTIAAVILTMALAAEASVYAWHGDDGAWDGGHHGGWGSHGISLKQGSAWNGDDHGAWGSHGISLKQGSSWNGDHHGAWGSHGISLKQGSSWNGDHHGAWGSHGPVHTHGISLKQGSSWDGHHYAAPAHYAYAPAHHDHHHHHDAHYVAKTLGAVHTAPLPGHVDSVKSFNVAPAPGKH